LKINRLFFIDAVRAFAILMMLQGHFIDTLLNPIYRDTSNTVYNIWSYFRGITAPTFFTISGLIFIYLLLKAKEKGDDKKRIRKGFMRGLLIIGIGYLIRIPILGWLTGNFNSYFLVIDVLQIIGVSLLLLVGLYIITLKKPILLSISLFAIGVLCFLTEPLYRNLNLNGVPELFSNYLTDSNGSIFTLLPWFGYVAFGGSLAILFFKYNGKAKFKLFLIISLVLTGIVLIKYSSFLLNKMYQLTEIQLFEDAAYYNYLFTRLGNVLLLFAVFYAFERFLKQSIITKIGQKTLSIYVIHFIIIYGSFTGFGLTQLIGKTLNPWQAVFGAILFLIVVCFISFHRVKTNTFVYNKIRKLVTKFK